MMVRSGGLPAAAFLTFVLGCHGEGDLAPEPAEATARALTARSSRPRADPRKTDDSLPTTQDGPTALQPAPPPVVGSASDVRVKVAGLRAATESLRERARALALDGDPRFVRLDQALQSALDNAGLRRFQVASRRLQAARALLDEIRGDLDRADPDPSTLDPKVLAAARQGLRHAIQETHNRLVNAARDGRALGVDLGPLEAAATSRLDRARTVTGDGRLGRAGVLLAQARAVVKEIIDRVHSARRNGNSVRPTRGSGGTLTLAELAELHEASADGDALMQAVFDALFPAGSADREQALGVRPEGRRTFSTFQAAVKNLYDEHFGPLQFRRNRDGDRQVVGRGPAKRFTRATVYRRLIEAIDPRHFQGLRKQVRDGAFAWSGSVGDDVLEVGGTVRDLRFSPGFGNDRLVTPYAATIDGGALSFDAGHDRLLVTGQLTRVSVDTGSESDRVRIVGGVQGCRFQGGPGRDSLAFAGSVIRSRVAGGDDADRVLVLGSARGTTIDGGDGDDVIVLAGEFRGVTADLGKGNDVIVLADSFVGDLTILDPQRSWIDWKGRYLQNHDLLELDGDWEDAGNGRFYRRNARKRVVASVRIGSGEPESDEIEVIRGARGRHFRRRDPEVGKPPDGVVFGQILAGAAFSWVPGPGGAILSGAWAVLRSDGDPFAIVSGGLGIASGIAGVAEAGKLADTLQLIGEGVAGAGRLLDGDILVSDILNAAGVSVRLANQGRLGDATRVLSAAEAVAGMAERGLVDPLGLLEIARNVVELARDEERPLALKKDHLKAKDLDAFYFSTGLLSGQFQLVSAPAARCSGNWCYDPANPRSFDSTAALQNRLRLLGYYEGAVDGTWTSELTLAVRAFHIANLTSHTPDTGQVGAGTASRMFSDERSYAADNPVAQERLRAYAEGADFEDLDDGARARTWRGVLAHLSFNRDLSGHNGLGDGVNASLGTPGVPTRLSLTQREYGNRINAPSVTISTSTTTPFVGAQGGTRLNGLELTFEVHARLTLRETIYAASLAANLLGQPHVGVPLAALATLLPADIGVQGTVSLNVGQTGAGVPYVRLNVARSMSLTGGSVGGSTAQIRSWQLRLDRLNTAHSNLPERW